MSHFCFFIDFALLYCTVESRVLEKNEEARDVCSQNQSDITKIYQMLLQYQPFQLQNPPNMTTLATKDVASQEIVDDILSVFE